MKFGQRILAAQHSAWSPFYLDYNGLKKILEESCETAQQSGHKKTSSFASTISLLSISGGRNTVDEKHPLSTRFLQALNDEVEKVVLFFLQEQGRIAYQLVQLRHEQTVLSSSFNPGETAEIALAGNLVALREKYNAAGKQLLFLIQFVDLNVTGVRKILKKHDKLMHWAASGFYLSGNRRSSCMMKPLLREEAMASLCVTLETALIELRQQEQALTGFGAPPAAHGGRSRAMSAHAVLLPHHMRTNTEPDNAPNAVVPHRRMFSVSQHETLLAFPPHPEDVILAQIHAARRRLKQSSEFVDMLAATAFIEASPSEEDEQDEDDEYKAPPGISAFLNLASTFLYMTNYYIVVPTVGTYSTKLGSQSALASMIVGMTPTAALVSTLLYSWWTSYSYKHALIFASVCSIVGNLFYACGLPFESMTFVMIGRLLNGFGSARSINRRYIADTFSRADRTAASAAFVSAGALGMAAGPAIASFLHVLSENSLTPYWQVENSPGWFMFVLWTVFLFMLIFFFEDPPKRKDPVVVEMTGEKKPLLATNGDGKTSGILSMDEAEEDPPIYKNVPVIVTFLIYFVLKLLLECVLSSTGMLTVYYFGWNGTISGIYLATLGLTMLPANFVVSRLSRSYEDREIIMGMQVIMVLGCVIIIKYGGAYTALQYLAGSVILFLSTNMLEGPNMSLLSKTIPRSWSRGFFNVGLLATEAGTLGRAVGDYFLTACGYDGVEYMINKTFGSMGAISFVTTLISFYFYNQLLPTGDKDD